MAKKKTQEEVIQEFRAVHANKYDYSLVKYVNSRTKITIICPKHGAFESTPESHRRGCICRKCANGVPTTNEWVDKAKSVHGKIYTYDRAKYIDQITAVTITCSTHGDFEQLPSNHIQGKGCPRCANRDMNTEKFAQRARNVHGDRFDYSNAVYVSAKDYVEIKCNRHNFTFKQTPDNHINAGYVGCSLCRYEQSGENQRLNSDDFFKAAEVKHGGKFDYTKDSFSGVEKSISFKCPIHGNQRQIAKIHLKSKHGCSDCADAHSGLRRRIGHEKLLPQLEQRFEGRICFAESNITTKDAKVKCRCLVDDEHGIFYRSPEKLLSSTSGCPSCSGRGFNPSRPGYLYVLGSNCGGMMKIGISNDHQQRIAHLAKVTPFEFAALELFHFANGKDANDLETELLRAGTRVESADKFDGHSEWLEFDGQLVELARKRHRDIK